MGRLSRWRLPLVALAVIGLAFATAACGGGSPEAGLCDRTDRCQASMPRADRVHGVYGPRGLGRCLTHR